MAIKGKRRTRSRSGRTVAMAPRPFLVRPKTPLMRRTGTKVVLVLLGWIVVFGVLVMADAQSDADRRREEISEFTSLVEAQLYQGGAAQESFGGPLVLPELGQALSQLQAEEGNPSEVVESSSSWADLAGQAAEGVGGIDVELGGLQEARNLMQRGLDLYAALARQVGVAAELEGPSRRTLLETIGDQMTTAAMIFDAGYGALQEERREAGLPVSTAPAGGLPGGLPGDFGGFPPPGS
ncbi:MAG TPA: hypothetical protein VE962_02295 [Actinomycetota bacterium]|nr:hypothetical protein [Actinomycetota bacterium]